MDPPRSRDPGTLGAPPRGLARWMPGLASLLGPKEGTAAGDVFAGLVLTAILVPAGMGYAQAAGLPAISGLYATIGALVAYAIFGPSRILVLGPDSALTALIAATVVPLAAGDADRAVALAGMLAVLSGAMCVAAGLARLGFVSSLVSKPIRYGYLNGMALAVIAGQLPEVLGLPAGGDSVVSQAAALAKGALGGGINGTAFAIGASCLAVIAATRRWAPRVPGALVAVVGATLAASLWNLGARGVELVGALPRGLPIPGVPAVPIAEVGTLVAGAAAIALVSFADTSVLSHAFAARRGRRVDSDQELVALGAANIAAGLMHGFPVSSSASRTPVAEAAGAKSQLAGLVGAACVALLLVLAPALLASLPRPALAAVVVAGCAGLVEVRGLLRLSRLHRAEFALSLVCFLGVALLGVIQGIFIAIGLALFGVVWRAWRPYDAVLGRVDGMKGYHDLSRHPEARRVPGLVLFRWDAPLFFANAEIFRDHVLRAVAEAPTRTRWVIVAAEPVTDVDVTAADMLAELDQELHAAGVDLLFAEMKGPVKDRLKRYGLFAALGTENFFPTIGQAVGRYLEVHDVEWKDWDE